MRLSTPCIYHRRVSGTETIPEVIFTDWTHGITAIDFATGKVNWEVDVFGDDKERAIGSPIVVGDLVVGTCGFVTAKRHAVAVKPVARDGAVHVEEMYRIERQVPHVPTVLAYDGRLFLWSEKGILSCFDVESGEMLYQKRVGGNYSGSPVCINGHLYCISDDGEVVVVRAAREYEEVARNALGEYTRSTPAAADGRLFLRTASHLVCIAQP